MLDIIKICCLVGKDSALCNARYVGYIYPHENPNTYDNESDGFGATTKAKEQIYMNYDETCGDGSSELDG